MEPKDYYQQMLDKAKDNLKQAKRDLKNHQAPRFADTYRGTLEAKVDMAQKEADKWAERLAKIGGSNDRN